MALHNYPTVKDAADEFGVSTKTVTKWINNGIIPEPPTVEVGMREFRHFSPAYMVKARKALAEHKKKKKRIAINKKKKR